MLAGAEIVPGTDAEIVASHCTKDLSWLQSSVDSLAALGTKVIGVHIYSKCGLAPIGAPAGAHLHTLPNVGRNDQVYAEYLATRHHSLPGQVFFLKDSSFHYGGHDLKKYERSAVQMAQELRTRGFSCGRAPPHCASPHCAPEGNGSQWHERAILEAFVLRNYKEKHTQRLRGVAPVNATFKSPTQSIGAWLASVLSEPAYGELRTREVWPVCYGGSFATRREQILRVSAADWAALAKSLSRADNLEEGHYMERSWAALLSPPLPTNVARQLLCHPAVKKAPYSGMLLATVGHHTHKHTHKHTHTHAHTHAHTNTHTHTHTQRVARARWRGPMNIGWVG